jgi:spermidine synthase
MALSWASKGRELGRPAGIKRAQAAFTKSKIKTDYYNAGIHAAAFTLPEWIKRLKPKSR